MMPDIMIIRRNLITTFVLLLLLPYTCAFAEVSCSLPVSYEWERRVEPSVFERGMKGKATEMMSPKKETSIEFVRRLIQKGEDEESVKRSLLEKAELLKRGILRECMAVHENYAGCVASRYRAYSSDIRTGGFSARKALEDAIAQDCRNLQGRCHKVIIPDPHCREIKKKGEEGDKSKGSEKSEKKK